MSSSEMRLAGICKDCISRLGVDERLTMSLKHVNVAKLPKYDPKAMAGIQFQGLGHRGTTKITYKIAKTVKETMEDESSVKSKGGSSSR